MIGNHSDKLPLQSTVRKNNIAATISVSRFLVQSNITNQFLATQLFKKVRCWIYSSYVTLRTIFWHTLYTVSSGKERLSDDSLAWQQQDRIHTWPQWSTRLLRWKMELDLNITLVSPWIRIHSLRWALLSPVTFPYRATDFKPRRPSKLPLLLQPWQQWLRSVLTVTSPPSLSQEGVGLRSRARSRKRSGWMGGNLYTLWG